MAVTITKPVRRKLDRIRDRKGRALILTIYPEGTLGFRWERCQHEDLLPVQLAILRAAQVTADAQRTATVRTRLRRFSNLMK